VKRYRVVLSTRAFRHLAEIEQWIEKEAGVAIARRYRQAIVDHCFRLERFPNQGRSRADLRPGLRTLVFRGRVTVGYVVEGDEVQITAIAGRGRDMEAALDD
jgi:toxin ParE1/3/4